MQQQVDSLLEVDVQSIELGNGVINSAFVMLFKVTYLHPYIIYIFISICEFSRQILLGHFWSNVDQLA